MRKEQQIMPFKKYIFTLFIGLFLLLPGCLSGDNSDDSDNIYEDGSITLEVWHTFAAESKEEETFTNAIRDFETANPNIIVEITGLTPFSSFMDIYSCIFQS